MNIIKNTLLLLAGLAVAGLLGEFATRLVFDELTSTPNMQTWFGHRWKTEHVSYNSLRFREGEISPKSSLEKPRIAVMGDSFTFGQGIAEDDRYTNILGRRLAESGTNAEVLNFGWAGGNSADQVLQLEKFVLPSEPDFIILQWLPNDFEDSTLRWAPANKPLLGGSKLHVYLTVHSALYFLLDNQLKNLQVALNSGLNPYTESLLGPFADTDSEAYAAAIKPADDLLDDLNSTGIPYLVILYPMLTPAMHDDYPFEIVHQAMLERCELAQAVCVDMKPEFLALGDDFDYSSLWVNQFDPHPGEAANILVADILLQNPTLKRWLDTQARSNP